MWTGLGKCSITGRKSESKVPPSKCPIRDEGLGKQERPLVNNRDVIHPLQKGTGDVITRKGDVDYRSNRKRNRMTDNRNTET